MATSAAVVARGLLVALLMAAAASVDAMEVPDKWYFGGGMEDKDSGGMEVTVKKNGKVVVKPKMKPRSMRIKKFTTFVKPKGGAQARGATTPASTFTVALKAGSRTDDPAGAYYTVTWTNYAPGTFKFATDRIAVLIGCVFFQGGGRKALSCAEGSSLLCTFLPFHSLHTHQRPKRKPED
jgi:hypothetical protein